MAGEKKDTPEGRKSNRIWNDLQKELFWSDEHENVFFKLLQFRRKFAHPEVDLEEIRTQIPDDFTDEEKKRIQDIISMTEKVNELMQEDWDMHAVKTKEAQKKLEVVYKPVL